MTYPGIIFSVVIGGVLTLLGTLLANFLQYRSEQRKRRRERVEERLAEVRGHLMACYEFADWMSILTLSREELEQRGQLEGFIQLTEIVSDSDYFRRLESPPVKAYPLVFFVEDKELLQWFERINALVGWIYFNHQGVIGGGKGVVEREQVMLFRHRCKELKELVVKAGARLDELLDKV